MRSLEAYMMKRFLFLPQCRCFRIEIVLSHETQNELESSTVVKEINKTEKKNKSSTV